MKKHVYLSIFGVLFWLIAIPGSIQSQEEPSCLKMASWNIRVFSDSRTDEQLRSICRVAKNFDFIAIQELRDENVLQRMVAMLKNEFGRSYSYELSPYVGYYEAMARGYDESVLSEAERGNQELYAFLYDKSFIRVVERGKLFPDSTFFRRPYYATFRAGSFDFTTIVIHVIWGNSVENRRKEIRRLAHVYQTIQDSAPHENDVILMGDFNREPDDDLAWGNIKSISGMIHLFNVPEKSMIWDSNLYDNLWFQGQYVKEFTLDRGIVRFDESDFGNNDQKASLDVSDHRPVWGLFRITGTDDD